MREVVKDLVKRFIQDIELKKLLENLISDKAKEIYKIIE